MIIQRKLDVLVMDPYFDVHFAAYADLDRRYGLDVVDNSQLIDQGVSDLLGRI